MDKLKLPAGKDRWLADLISKTCILGSVLLGFSMVLMAALDYGDCTKMCNEHYEPCRANLYRMPEFSYSLPDNYTYINEVLMNGSIMG